MNRLKSLIIGLVAISLAGCGQTVVETLKVTDGPSHGAPGSGKSIVILPFADYSQGNIDSALRRNMVITESLSDRLTNYGFGLPVQEDVFDYLVDEGVINIADYTPADTGSLAVELKNDWSDVMKGEIQRYMDQVEEESRSKMQNSPGAHSLTPQKLAKIGRHFNADYIMRGRILEYKTRQEATWAPWKKGLLPFVNGGANRILNGFASSEDYDARNESVTGMLIFGTIAYNSASWPWESGESVFGRDGRTANTVLWGAVGNKAGAVSHTSGNIEQATVQLRIWVQEASTGNIVWTNRVRVLVSPETIMADNQYDTLFNLAIDKGVDSLLNHFVSYGL